VRQNRLLLQTALQKTGRTVCVAMLLFNTQLQPAFWKRVPLTSKSVRVKPWIDCYACVLNFSSEGWPYIEAATINQNELCVGYPYPSRSAGFVRAAAIIASITYPIVVLRFISRIFITRCLWWDDWFILIAVVCDLKTQRSPQKMLADNQLSAAWFLIPSPQLIVRYSPFFSIRKETNMITSCLSRIWNPFLEC
jgi:hypothetical protein